MCIIVYIPKGSICPDEETLWNCWLSNPDGGGVTVHKPGKETISVFKSMDEEKFIKRVVDWANKYGEESDIVAHFRIGTSGNRDLTNVHPFHLHDQRAVLFHNGVLPEFTVKGSPKSDTRYFAEFLRTLPPGFMFNPAVMYQIRKIVSGDKLVFQYLSEEGLKTILVNEETGIWENGVWYSNDGYKRNWWSKSKTDSSVGKNACIMCDAVDDSVIMRRAWGSYMFICDECWKWVGADA